ncbi:signal peptidase I [Kiritimatiella glycovorans]|uniref:Signal peptidase I n=1 Tax=Kiritimatiella glycovorans TaxID=1307763 RepID=A0A0G3EJE2_9BACT|nr:signal peptidase I [Kiritimatiella glycovorans]AKJ64294.1 Signal peptidase IB [Kiritimatiella glycovorans]
MNILQRRQWRKRIKNLLKDARHVRRMREDVVDAEKIERLNAAADELRRRGSERASRGELERASEDLGKAMEAVSPARSAPKLRENLEVFVVAIAAAMAIRAYFFQPFKIPTGSMEPTLNGITVEAKADGSWIDVQPFKFAKWLVTGRSYKEIRSKSSGYLRINLRERIRDRLVFHVGGTRHLVPEDMARYIRVPVVRRGGVIESTRPVRRGEVLASGEVRSGDHILVNKIVYNFTAPERGDVVVFDTQGLSGVRQDSYYIKRMAGVPDETVGIDDGGLIADGEVVDRPEIFQRLRRPPYVGYRNKGRLADSSDRLVIGPDEFLPLGDNSDNSRDGRYFGPVSTEQLLGPAFIVYWPFDSQWGWIP